MFLYSKPKIKKPSPREKNLESTLEKITKFRTDYNLFDSMRGEGAVIATILVGIFALCFTNTLYSLGAALLTDVGVGKLDNMIYHHLKRKDENEYSLH